MERKRNFNSPPKSPPGTLKTTYLLLLNLKSSKHRKSMSSAFGVSHTMEHAADKSGCGSWRMEGRKQMCLWFFCLVKWVSSGTVNEGLGQFFSWCKLRESCWSCADLVQLSINPFSVCIGHLESSARRLWRTKSFHGWSVSLQVKAQFKSLH